MQLITLLSELRIIFNFKQHFEEKKKAHLLCSVRNIITTNSPVVNQVLFYNHQTKNFVHEKASQLKKEHFQPSFASLLAEAVAINSKAFVKNGVKVGDKIECALLEFITSALETDYEAVRAESNIYHTHPFTKRSRTMSTLVESKKSEKKYTFYVKGAPDIIVPLSSTVHNGDHTDPLSDDLRKELQKQISVMETEGLITVAIAYESVDEAQKTQVQDQTPKDLTLLAIFGLRDSLRQDSPESFSHAIKSGFQVHLITGSSPLYAAYIGKSIGLEAQQNEILEESAFFELLKKGKEGINFDNLKILAHSSSETAVALMENLQSKGELVVVVGSSLADAAELMTNADLALALGSAPDVVKEAADAIILDDRFASVVRAAVGITAHESCKVQ
eukprot:TRINITY_DN4929_c0_g1_i4.p1 TRINITY_DN4929_c0_g1~~TRINITY_DN4929_c0_g1_i4.p1  ORF type:complete len:390 (+),score=112.31 TRINITY_DN4929_c0_g1_i4:720-1889(+)